MSYERASRRCVRQSREKRERAKERTRKYLRSLVELRDEGAAADQRRSAEYVYLRGAERRELKRIVNSGKSEQRMVLRAAIVQQAGSGHGNKAIARELRCSEKTVRKWRSRFIALRLWGLMDAPREGRPWKFSAQIRHLVIAKVLSPPPRGVSSWSLEEVAAAVVADGTVPSISKEIIGRWFRAADLKPHRNKYWLNCKDPEFVQKMNRVVELYLHPPKDGMLLCVDEKTGMQALSRKHPDKPVRIGSVKRTEFEYKRHGTASLLAAFDVKTGHVDGYCFSKDDGIGNDSKTFIGFLESLMSRYPPTRGYRKIYLILDNASSHTSHETTAFLKRHRRLVPIFLPVHGSWLNQVEMWFGVLSRRSLKGASFKSTRALMEHIDEYIKYHNLYKKHPYKWTKKGLPLSA